MESSFKSRVNSKLLILCDLGGIGNWQLLIDTDLVYSDGPCCRDNYYFVNASAKPALRVQLGTGNRSFFSKSGISRKNC